jgi:hypothetical protein
VSMLRPENSSSSAFSDMNSDPAGYTLNLPAGFGRKTQKLNYS